MVSMAEWEPYMLHGIDVHFDIKSESHYTAFGYVYETVEFHCRRCGWETGIGFTYDAFQKLRNEIQFHFEHCPCREK
jgi:hypothetical protein